MRFEILSALILSVLVATYAVETEPSPAKPEDSRLFVYSGSGITFTTFTVIKATTTRTSTLTSTTICTTSTAALSTCTVGGRRRGLFFDESASRAGARRGLFYDDAEVDGKDGHVFLPSPEKRLVIFFCFAYNLSCPFNKICILLSIISASHSD